MEPTGGDLDKHDHEFEQVRWIGFDEAGTTLTFETERALVAHAADLLAAGAGPGRECDRPGRRDADLGTSRTRHRWPSATARWARG